MITEDYSKYYIQGSDHYLIPKDEFIELFDEMINWKEENEQLKKQLENKYSKTGTLTNEVLYEENAKLINQQQEFIKYLEDTIAKEKEDLSTVIELMKLSKEDLKYNGAYKFCISFITKLEKILSKYKEIIGVDENGQ